MSICYEIVFPDEVAQLAQNGATVLVTITNDAWYGDTSAPWQHFRAARFRAAENRRPLLRAAITGVSALVGPDALGLGADRRLSGRGHPLPRGGKEGLTPTPACRGCSRCCARSRPRGGGDRSGNTPAGRRPDHDRFRRPPADRNAFRATHEPPGVSLRKPDLNGRCPISTDRCRCLAFWDNPQQNAAIMQQRRAVEKRLQTLNRLRADGDELATWRELLEEGGADPDFDKFIDRLENDLEKLELELKLAGPDDDKSAIVAIHPGAGGTESQDWAEMLLRMYLRWAEQNDYQVEMLERQDGDEAGIKSATFAVRGENAYGYLEGGGRRPPPGADQPVRLPGAAPHVLRFGRRVPRGG